MRRRIFLALAAVVALACGVLAAANAQPSTPAALGLYCPHVPNPVLGQQVTCTYVGGPVPTTTTTVPPSTTTTTKTAGPTTTTTTATPPSAFPTAETTGPPAGLALTAVNGDLATTSAGQVIDARLVSGDLVLRHDNVTVKNSRITGRVVDNGRRGLVLDHVDLGPDACPSGPSDYAMLRARDVTVRFSHLHNHNNDLVNIMTGGTYRIEDSLLDRTCYYRGDHLDAVQVFDTGDAPHDVTITRSSLDSRASNSYGNAAIQIGDDPPNGSRYQLTNSLWAGGGYTLRLYDMRAASGSSIVATGNTIVKGTWEHGPCVSSNSVNAKQAGQTGLYWSGNRLSDGTVVGC
ncbi:MAG: hypothetical protein QOF58_2321 [Pseudonocardiales bacterium]|jgi:hypothetical protein|nr:hypothetical protein [Pseudonocardiales bacterium]